MICADTGTEQLELDDIEILVDAEIESLVEDLVESIEDEIGPEVSSSRLRPPWRPRPVNGPPLPSRLRPPSPPKHRAWTRSNLAAAFEDDRTQLWVRPRR